MSAYETSRKQLNYMQAWIKYYDDGSEILQSYSTDVVKKTPDGKYIRLWRGWSPTTMKHVKTWCGHYFRGLPYSDGTHEDLSVASKMLGFSKWFNEYENAPRPTHREYYTKEDIVSNVNNIINQLEKKPYAYKDMRHIFNSFNTTCYGRLYKYYKGNDRLQRLITIMNMCVKENVTKYKKFGAENITVKLCDFNFKKIWDNSLCQLYPEYEWNSSKKDS